VVVAVVELMNQVPEAMVNPVDLVEVVVVVDQVVHQVELKFRPPKILVFL
tara:strand:+ start:184 stop:333 length:150 start_codon:yes stop_codon:yes gene_type:complete